MINLPAYTYQCTERVWTFVSDNSENLGFELNEPMLVSELQKMQSVGTFVCHEMDRDLVVDCPLTDKVVISLAARRIVVLPRCEVGAPWMRLETKEFFLCLGNLKFYELGDLRYGRIFPILTRYYPGLIPLSHPPEDCSAEWRVQIERAYRLAGRLAGIVLKGELEDKTNPPKRRVCVGESD